MTPQQKAAMEEYRRYVDEYANGNIDQYEANGNLIMDQVGDSQMGEIVTDPRYKEHELTALNELTDQSRNGFTAGDMADIARTENIANRANRGRVESIRQNMQARGMGGSGLDLMAQLQSAQDSNEMEALKALEREGAMQDRKSQATMNLGGLSSQLQGRDFEQQSSKARAQDAINQFNVNNRNQANAYNFGNRQDVNNRNVAANNNFKDKRYQAQTGMAGKNYDAATEEYNQRQARDAEKRKQKGNMMGGVMSGAATGASVGGPWGAAVGGILGGAATQMAHGGRVPGESRYPGFDTTANDTFDAELSPNEIVIPASIAHDPVASAKFVAAQNQGFDPMASKYMASPDPYDSVPEFEPDAPKKPTPPPTRPRIAPSVPENKPISDSALKLLAEKNPSLVEQYRARMQGSNKAMEDAEGNQDFLGNVNAIGKGVTDIQNMKRGTTIYANDWQNMGGAPKTVRDEERKWDGSTLEKTGAQGVQRARDARDRDQSEFMREQQLGQMDKANTRDQAMNDPASAESQSARAFLKSLLPNAEKIQGFENFSAARLEKVSPMLMEKWKADRAQANTDRDFGLKEKELGLKSQNKTKLSGEEQKRLDSAGMALAGIQGMRKALAKGDNTFSVMGDNDFTLWRTDFEEGLGRMQSGGVIGKDEVDTYRKMAPTMMDSPAMQSKKLAKLEAELSARISGMGADPTKALSDRGTSTFKDAPHGQRVKQNGVEFEWNGTEYLPVGG